jgi:type II secretory pathway pseudopilin PulG
LLVVIAIVVILFSIFVPYALKVRESDRRVRCAENLRAIGHALSQYADRNGRDYPRVRFDPLQPGYTAFTGADAPDPFGLAAAHGQSPQPAQVQANDVTASLWLVARQGYVEPYRFACPSTGDTPDPLTTQGGRVKPDQRSNFTGPRHLSYSYASPFSANPRFRLNSDVLPADFALLADKNPGTTGKGTVTGPAYDAPRDQFAQANSRNHGRAGQNVLYPTGVVEFQGTPYCGYAPPREPTGIYRDNVYTAYAAAPLAGDAVPTDLAANGVRTPAVGPAWVYDSYLVPTEEE